MFFKNTLRAPRRDRNSHLFLHHPPFFARCFEPCAFLLSAFSLLIVTLCPPSLSLRRAGVLPCGKRGFSITSPLGKGGKGGLKQKKAQPDCLSQSKLRLHFHLPDAETVSRSFCIKLYKKTILIKVEMTNQLRKIEYQTKKLLSSFFLFPRGQPCHSTSNVQRVQQTRETVFAQSCRKNN